MTNTRHYVMFNQCADIISLLVFYLVVTSPSIWYAAVAAPHQKVGLAVLLTRWLPCGPMQRDDSCPITVTSQTQIRRFVRRLCFSELEAAHGMCLITSAACALRRARSREWARASKTRPDSSRKTFRLTARCQGSDTHWHADKHNGNRKHR